MTLTALEIKSKHPFTLSMLSAQISTLIIYQLVFLTFIKHNEFSFPTQDLCICWPLEIEYLPLCLPSLVSPSHFGGGLRYHPLPESFSCLSYLSYFQPCHSLSYLQLRTILFVGVCLREISSLTLIQILKAGYPCSQIYLQHLTKSMPIIIC